MFLKRICFVVACMLAIPAFVESAPAQEPGWYPYVVARGSSNRQRIESTPIVERQYRPFHFYGNTVRRNHYRGNPWPTPRDWARTFIYLTPRRR